MREYKTRSRKRERDSSRLPSEPKITKLFLGEADFSYALAYAKKHPNRANQMIATTYESEEALRKLPFYDRMQENKAELEKRGVVVKHGVDATNSSTWNDGENNIEQENIERIYFSHPHTQSRKYHTGNVLKGLFNEASDLNVEQIHIPRVWVTRKNRPKHDSLPLGVEPRYGFGTVLDGNKELRGKWKLEYKHNFNKERYSEYEHTKTKGGGSAASVESGESVEFVFKRNPWDPQNSDISNELIYKKARFDIDTDDESETEDESLVRSNKIRRIDKFKEVKEDINLNGFNQDWMDIERRKANFEQFRGDFHLNGFNQDWIPDEE